MSKLSQVFESIKHSLHWGPSVEPFHQAVIEVHDALEKRIEEMEAKWNEMFPPRPKEAPAYITAEEVKPDEEVSAKSEQTPEQGQQNPAEPVQTPVSDLLEAQPEPVPAGPIVEEAETQEVSHEVPQPEQSA